MLTNLRTNVEILSCRTAIKHVNYLAKISPFVELDFSIDFGIPEDIKFIKKLSRQIENKSLSKFRVYIDNPSSNEHNWESEATIKSVLSIINLVSEFNKQYEIEILGKKVQVIELPNWIKLTSESIFGENQWIVRKKFGRFSRLLGEYTQIWKELGIGELDLNIFNWFKSPIDIFFFIIELEHKIHNSCRNMLDIYKIYYMKRDDYYKVFGTVFLDQLYMDQLDDDISKINNIYPLIKPFLRMMRSLKTINLSYFKEIYETITKLDLNGLQQNGVEINFYSNNIPDKYKHTFIITADEGIILHTNKEIEALNLKMKGDIEIGVYTWDFTYIVNNQYLLWVWYSLSKFEIDWEMIENKQKFWFPKFTQKLKGSYNWDLILIPLKRIKTVSYEVYFDFKDEVNNDTKNLTNEFDSQIWTPLTQPSSLFFLLNKETKIDICIPKELEIWTDDFWKETEKWNNNLLDEFEEELNSYIPISPSIKCIEIYLFDITNENVNSFLQLLKGWIRLNVLIFKVRESDQRISQDIVDTITKYNEWLSQVDVSINTEGAEFLHFAQISCDRNIIIRTHGEE